MKKYLMVPISVLMLAGFIAKPGFSASKINIKGFGSATVTPQNNKYLIDIPKIGALSCTGTLAGSKSRFQTNTQVSKLHKIPGYQALQLLGIKNITMSISPDGIFFTSQIPTNGKLKTLMRFLHIQGSSITARAGLSLEGVHLEGTLDLKKAINITVSKKLGSAIRYTGFTLGMIIGKAPAPETTATGTTTSQDTQNQKKKTSTTNPTLFIIGRYEIKPTKWDPYLKLETSFSYNLLSQQISLGAVIKSKWTNPIGIQTFLKHFAKNVKAIEIQDAGLEIGWIPGTPTPTKIGIAAKKMNFFGSKFGFALDLNPTDGQVAFLAEKKSLNLLGFLNIFPAIPRSMLPKNFKLKNVKILFSPNGGSVGTISIQQGLELKGTAQLGSGLSGSLNCYADFSRGMQLQVKFSNHLQNIVKQKFKKQKVLKNVLGALNKSFTIRSANALIKINIKKIQSKLKIKFYALNQKFDINVKGTLRPDKIADSVVQAVNKFVKNQVAKTIKKVQKNANKQLKNAEKNGEKAIKAIDKFSKKTVKAIVRGLSTRKKNKERMMKWGKNVAKRAKKHTHKSINDFIKDVKADALTLDPEDRAKAINKSWIKLGKQEHGLWKRIRKNKNQYSFLRKKHHKDAQKYRSYIDAQWKKTKKWMDKQYKSNLKIKPPKW